ncbi:unnamed protein product [Colias eurytheme]|nr:unnamed protein product [Colias eurytheme]
MVKFGKNKLKILNKLAKKQNANPNTGNTNKILKKKINAEKKVTFQKEVLLKESVKSDVLVKNVTKNGLFNNLTKNVEKVKSKQDEPTKKKLKPVEKQKKRQKTQINDTRLLLNLMKKKS